MRGLPAATTAAAADQGGGRRRDDEVAKIPVRWTPAWFVAERGLPIATVAAES